MKHKALLTIIYFYATTILVGQQHKKLIKLLDYEVKKLDASESYSWRPEGDEVTYFPSRSLKGDTVGAANNMEYLMFRDSMYFKTGESFKLFRGDWVTYRDWYEFTQSVIDSIERDNLYFCLYEEGYLYPSEAASFLNYEETYYDSSAQKMVEFNPDEVWQNRHRFHLNYDFKWHKKVDDEQYQNCLYSLYKGPHERMNKKKEVDARKLDFVIDGDMPWAQKRKVSGYESSYKTYINISTDPTVWIKHSKHLFDGWYSIANYYSQIENFDYMPVQGLVGSQIQAYLHFKEKQLQKKIDDKGLPYEVRLALPTLNEIEEACGCENKTLNFEIEGRDMTDHWRITYKDYGKFYAWVEDSLAREYFHEDPEGLIEIEERSNMLVHEDYYYDEGMMEYVEFDPADAFINRQNFYFNYDYNWRKKLSDDIINNYKENEGFKGTLHAKPYKMDYEYYRKDLERQNQWGTYEWDNEIQQFEVSSNSFQSRDLDLGFGVWRHEDNSMFIVREQLNIHPDIDCRDCNKICEHEHGQKGEASEACRDKKCPPEKYEFYESLPPFDFTQTPDSLMQELSYEQAKVYYHWKYQQTSNPTKKMSQVYYEMMPSEEQFKKIQSGERVVLDDDEQPYPDPLFRYVIHVFEKD